MLEKKNKKGLPAPMNTVLTAAAKKGATSISVKNAKQYHVGTLIMVLAVAPPPFLRLAGQLRLRLAAEAKPFSISSIQSTIGAFASAMSRAFRRFRSLAPMNLS